MITGSQIRAARFALRLSTQELAKTAGVILPKIQRFEQVDPVPPSRSVILLEVKKTLEAAGIEFIGTPEKGLGVRLCARSQASLNRRVRLTAKGGDRKRRRARPDGGGENRKLKIEPMARDVTRDSIEQTPIKVDHIRTRRNSLRIRRA
jgi:transcriptional regulator with XRE-family HTH domain